MNVLRNSMPAAALAAAMWVSISLWGACAATAAQRSITEQQTARKATRFM
jgi:hypothetical protein